MNLKVLLTLSALALGGCGPTITSVPVRSIEVAYGDFSGAVKTTSIVNPEIVHGVMQVLRSGESVIVCDHKSSIILYLALEDGRSIEIAVLPGRVDGQLEYRTEQGQYRISRTELAALLEPVGVGLPVALDSHGETSRQQTAGP